MKIPRRAPCHAGFVTPVHGDAARRIVTAETHGDYTDATRIDIGTRLKVIDCHAARDLEVMSQVHAAKANHLALDRAVDQQTGQPAQHQIRRAAQTLELFLGIDTTEPHHARIALRRAVLGMHKVRPKQTLVRRKLDRLDARAIGERSKLREAVDRFAIHGHREVVLRPPKMITQLILQARAQIVGRRRPRMAAGMRGLHVRG